MDFEKKVAESDRKVTGSNFSSAVSGRLYLRHLYECIKEEKIQVRSLNPAYQERVQGTTEREVSAIAMEAEQKLASSLSTAGGEIRLKSKKENKPAGLKSYYASSILNANGEEFAILRYEWKGSSHSVVTLALPDGSVVWSAEINKGQEMALNASAGDSFGQVQARWNKQGMNTFEKRALACGGSVGELMAGGQPVLSIVAPSQPWLLPFLTLTLCMGCFCLPPQESRIMRGLDCVGTAIGSDVAKSDDPAILRASINILAILNCLDQWKTFQD